MKSFSPTSTPPALSYGQYMEGWNELIDDVVHRSLHSMFTTHSRTMGPLTQSKEYVNMTANVSVYFHIRALIHSHSR